MKISLALWIVSILLTAGGKPDRHATRAFAPTTVAQERFQAGPLSLEIRVQAADREDSEGAEWLVSRIGVNTEVFASASPLSFRAVLVLTLGGDGTEAAA